MSALVVSRQIDPTEDRESFHFSGLPVDSDRVAGIADAGGRIVRASGVSPRGSWITLAKNDDGATPFTTLLAQITATVPFGRIVPDQP